MASYCYRHLRIVTPNQNQTLPVLCASFTYLSILKTLTLSVQYMFIWLNQGGRLIAGWPDEPFRGQLQIILRGSHSTPDWLLPSGPNQGSKVLGKSTWIKIKKSHYWLYMHQRRSSQSFANLSVDLSGNIVFQVCLDLLTFMVCHTMCITLSWLARPRQETALSLYRNLWTGRSEDW